MIRLAKQSEIQIILDIYSAAKEFMHSNGNPNQWNGAYPDKDTLLCDIENEHLYVMTDEKDKVYACFALIGGEDPTYEYIDGKWMCCTPYGTIHRIARSGMKKGVMRECFEFARKMYNHLRVDTHEDNKPMQRAVLECGFEYRGVIYLSDGSPRLAYEWCE